MPPVDRTSMESRPVTKRAIDELVTETSRLSLRHRVLNPRLADSKKVKKTKSSLPLQSTSVATVQPPVIPLLPTSRKIAGTSRVMPASSSTLSVLKSPAAAASASRSAAHAARKMTAPRRQPAGNLKGKTKAPTRQSSESSISSDSGHSVSAASEMSLGGRSDSSVTSVESFVGATSTDPLAFGMDDSIDFNALLANFPAVDIQLLHQPTGSLNLDAFAMATDVTAAGTSSPSEPSLDAFMRLFETPDLSMLELVRQPANPTSSGIVNSLPPLGPLAGFDLSQTILDKRVVSHEPLLSVERIVQGDFNVDDAIAEAHAELAQTAPQPATEPRGNVFGSLELAFSAVDRTHFDFFSGMTEEEIASLVPSGLSVDEMAEILMMDGIDEFLYGLSAEEIIDVLEEIHRQKVQASADPATAATTSPAATAPQVTKASAAHGATQFTVDPAQMMLQPVVTVQTTPIADFVPTALSLPVDSQQGAAQSVYNHAQTATLSVGLDAGTLQHPFDVNQFDWQGMFTADPSLIQPATLGMPFESNQPLAYRPDFTQFGQPSVSAFDVFQATPAFDPTASAFGSFTPAFDPAAPSTTFDDLSIHSCQPRMRKTSSSHISLLQCLTTRSRSATTTSSRSCSSVWRPWVSRYKRTARQWRRRSLYCGPMCASRFQPSLR